MTALSSGLTVFTISGERRWSGGGDQDTSGGTQAAGVTRPTFRVEHPRDVEVLFRDFEGEIQVVERMILRVARGSGTRGDKSSKGRTLVSFE